MSISDLRGSSEIKNSHLHETSIHSQSKFIKRGVVSRVKPSFYKNLGLIMNSHIDGVLDYLDINDLAITRQANKLFLAIVHEYYPKRLRFEVENIKYFQERNDKIFFEFMKIIDSQIPISNRNWLEFELGSVLSNLKVLDKNVVTSLRGIKSIGKLPEAVFAPFCIIFGYNKNSFSMIKNEGWKKVSGKILAEPEFLRKLKNLDLDNLAEADMLDAFVYLNLPELQVENIRNYSLDLEKLILWCRAVLSYHILIHPFTYRNDKSHISPGTDMHSFISMMNAMLDRFYKFKRFLINLNIMTIPLGEYVFNLQHNREKVVEQENLGKYLSEKQIACILSYLPYNASHKFISVNKKWKSGFRLAIDLVIHEILKEVFFLKLQAGQSLSQRIPILFENNIFSEYFLMIEDIIDGEGPFLSKEQLNDIKNIKIESELIKSVAKVACLILNEKAEKRILPSAESKVLHLEKLKTMVINGQLVKSMKTLSKLDISVPNLKILSEELNPYLSLEKLEEVKKVNRGIYQLLIWELFVYELHKTYNPFEFISTEFIINRFEKEEVEIIKYFCDVMNYLKYNLKIKFRMNIGKGYELRRHIDELRNSLHNQKMNLEMIFYNSYLDLNKISTVYFETKDLIPQGAKPAFYERMFIEVLKLEAKAGKSNIEQSNNEIKNIYANLQQGALGTIKEENSINLEGSDKKQNYYSQIIANGNYQKEINKMQLLTHLNRSTKKPSIITFNDVPQDIIIKQVLFFLDINTLPRFSLVNKKANESVKSHIFIRLYFLNKEKKMIEQENIETIQSIEQKREEFFNDYEIDAPNKEHAIQMINMIKSDDIVELKQCFKKYNKNYENIIAPLVLLMGGKQQVTINPDGSKTSTFFFPAQKILNSKDFVKRLRELELETIPQSRFKAVEKILEGPSFNLDKIKQLSPCLHHLLLWVMGVIEFHRVIRKYSLSYYDHEILEEDEIIFCSEMDNILILYYKLLRYANTYCKKYEKFAHSIMASMNIPLGK